MNENKLIKNTIVIDNAIRDAKLRSVKPLVIISCIAYNQGKFLSQCLDGFVMQKTNFPYVAIIHDDASSDNTADVLREYSKKYPDIITPIFDNVNRYQEGTLRAVMGEVADAFEPKYIALCEGDDYWIDPYKLQKQFDFLESHDNYVLVHTDRNEDFNGVVVHKHNKIKMPEDDNYSLVLISEGNKIKTLTSFFRKKVYDRLPRYWESQNFRMGDYPLWIELAQEGKMKYLSDITANYRQLSESASHSDSIDKNIGFLKSVYDIRHFYMNKYNLIFNMKRLDINFYYYCINAAYHCNRKDVAEKFYNEARSKKLANFKMFIFCKLTSDKPNRFIELLRNIRDKFIAKKVNTVQIS